MLKENIETRDKTKSIVPSILWTDLYKLTMGNGVFQYFDQVGAKYEFINRGRTQFPEKFGHKLKDEIEKMSDLTISPSQEKYLREDCTYLDSNYVDWFKTYRFDPKEVKIKQFGGNLSIGIDGPWKRTIYWEVPLMTTISQLYFEETNQLPNPKYREWAREKGRRLKEALVYFFEFGTRRAYSTKIHENALDDLIETAGSTEQGGVLMGTSNVHLAHEKGINAGGTYAHEWVMFMAAKFGVDLANQKAMETWANLYLGRDPDRPTAYLKLATALTDTYTTEFFLKKLTYDLAKDFRNYRPDSGDPYVEGGKVVNRIRELGFDSKTKGNVFADALNTDKTIALNKHFSPLIVPTFGIGTDITNDVGVKPLNMVIKAISFIIDDIERLICKLPDDKGKESGDPRAIAEAKRIVSLAMAA